MPKIKVYEFSKVNGTGFCYVFEKELAKQEKIIVKMPVVSANKRGVNDIGWISDGAVKLSGTFAKDPTKEEALWQPINDRDEVNKTTAAIKIENMGDECRIEMRAILN